MKNKFKYAPIIFAISISSIAQPDKAVRLDDAYGDAFTNYKPYVVQGKQKDNQKPKASPNPTTQAPKAEEPKGEQAVNMDWLIKNYPLIEKRAIDNPTEANVSANL